MAAGWHCEELIGAGRVEVDGQTVRRFGARVDPEHQIIRVDGKRIPARQDAVYLAFNKPPKVLTAMSDDRGRARSRTSSATGPNDCSTSAGSTTRPKA